MRQIAFALIVTSTAALEQQSAPQTVPTIPFNLAPDFLKFPPDIDLREAAEGVVNSKGHEGRRLFACRW